MIERFVEPVSTYAADIDFVFAFIVWVVGFWFLATEGMFFYLLWKFRYKEGQPAEYITGKEKHLKRWVSIPHFLIIGCDVVLIVLAVKVWVDVKMDLPEPERAVEIEIISQQWAWTFVHPGSDMELGTEDDIVTIDEMHIQENTMYHFHLKSKDVLHDFSVPVFRLKQDALPGRDIRGWFEATKTGQFDIQCAEMCGIGHGIMGAQLFVESAEDHASWIEGKAES